MVVAVPSGPVIESPDMKTVDPIRTPRRTRSPAGPWAAMVLLTALALPAAAADDGARLLMDQGCLNCHSNLSHSAPTLDHLAKKMARKGDQSDALKHVLHEMRTEGNIHGHQMVSDESALAILKWLAQAPR